MFSSGKRDLFAAQSNLPESTTIPPMLVPWPPMYLVSECDDVGAVLERPAEHRGGYRVVDDQRHAVAVSGVGQCLQVDDVARRVADGFAEHGLGPLVDQRFQGGDVVVGGEARLDADAWQGGASRL